MANVSTLPKQGGLTELVSSSSSERCALDKAQERAQEICVGKRYVVMTNETKYQGADPNAKLVASILTNNNGSTNHDYRTTMTIKCE